MYQALYRKWRPKTFDDVVGQDHITSILKAQIIRDRLSHAYLFIGTRGTGKTSCAKILAKAANCENPQDGNPCNCCRACTGIDSGAILDVEELDAASNNGVDNVRALREEAVFSPASVTKRVYIIDEVHMLSNSAFNALLKILEEPPAHLMFILATTELHKVPATILSRCQRHSFRRLDSDVIKNRLSHIASAEGLTLTENAAELLSRLADGSMRDGLSLLDQCAGGDTIDKKAVLSSMGLAGTNNTSQLLSALSAFDIEQALTIFDALWTGGKNPHTVLAELATLLRDVLMVKLAPKGGRSLLRGGFDEDILMQFADSLSKHWLIYAVDTLSAALSDIERARNDNPRIASELCLIGLCSPENSDGSKALCARVSKLEETVKSGGLIAAKADKTDAAVIDTPIAPDVTPDTISVTIPNPILDAPDTPDAPDAPLDSSDMISSLTTLLTKRFQADAGTSNILWNEKQARITVRDGHFVILLETGFPFMMLNKPNILEVMRTAAFELFGSSITLKLEEVETGALLIPSATSPARQDEDNLDTLSRFGGIVTFD